MPTRNRDVFKAPLWLAVAGIFLGLCGSALILWWINSDLLTGAHALQQQKLAFSWDEHVFFAPGVLPIFIIFIINGIIWLCNGLRPVMIMAKIQNIVLIVGFFLAFGGYVVGRPIINAYLEHEAYTKCPAEWLPRSRTKRVYWVMTPSFCDDPEFYSQITFAEAQAYLTNASQRRQSVKWKQYTVKDNPFWQYGLFGLPAGAPLNTLESGYEEEFPPLAGNRRSIIALKLSADDLQRISNVLEISADLVTVNVEPQFLDLVGLVNHKTLDDNIRPIQLTVNPGKPKFESPVGFTAQEAFRFNAWIFLVLREDPT